MNRNSFRSCQVMLLVLVAASLPAQTTWIVDKGAGPGHNFTSLAPAIAATSAGDTIVMRPGTYNEGHLTIDKGITILGSHQVSISLSGLGSPGIIIENIPSDEACVLHGMRIGGSILSAAIHARDCDGLVLCENLEGTLGGLFIPTELSFQIERCQQAHLHGVFVRGGYAVSFVDSRGVISLSALEGKVTSVLILTNSQVTLDRCTISMESTPFQFLGPVVVDGGRLDVTRTTITAPNNASTPHPAVSATNNPTIRIDPTATITSATGQPEVAGTANVLNTELVSLTRTSTPAGTQLDLQGRTGAVFATFVSLPTTSFALPWGDVWVNLAASERLLLDIGVLTQRAHQMTFPTAGLPTGLALTVQAAVLDSSLTIGNGIGFVAN